MPQRPQYNPLLKDYPDSRKINSVSEGAEVLYVRLLAASDDEHRYYGDANIVLAKLFTQRMIRWNLTSDEVERRLAELEGAGLIQRYEIGGDRFLHILNCFKVFRADVKKRDARFPGPEEKSVTDADGPVTERIGAGRKRCLNPTQLIPNSTSTQRPPEWSDVVDVLKNLGLGRAEQSVKLCKKNCLRAEQVMAFALVFGQNRERWTGPNVPGVLYRRLEEAKPEDDPSDLSLWVPADERSKQRIQSQQSAERAEAHDERVAAERERAARDAAELETRFGPSLSALEPKPLSALAERVLAENAFLWRMYRESGIQAPDVRWRLLKQLETEAGGGNGASPIQG